MIAFRDVLEACNLSGLGFSGYPFTYDNKHSGRANVQVRLDRAVADNAWRNKFPEASVKHLISSCSDHLPLLLKCIPESGSRVACTRRYEVLWEREAALEEVVYAAWQEGGPKHGLHDIKVSLDSVMRKLHEWSRKKIGNVTKEIEKSRSRLEELMNMNADRSVIRKASDHLDELLYKEEMLWRQRSRIEWLKEGDRNTKFFQQKAVWRARKNKIKGLEESSGVFQTNQKVMEGMAVDYFKNCLWLMHLLMQTMWCPYLSVSLRTR